MSAPGGTGPVHLAPPDTVTVPLVASTVTGTWARMSDTFVRRDALVPGGSWWSTLVTESKAPHRSATLDHDTVVAAMRAIVAARDTLTMDTRTIDRFAAVLDAPHPEAAREELEQVDCFGCDKLVQYILFGEITYG